jgi:hypothetical protein
MTSQPTLKISILTAFVLLIVALIVLSAFASPAQQAGTSQPSAKFSARALHPAQPAVDSVGRVAVSRVHTKRRDARLMTTDSSLSFLPVVTYDSGGSVAGGDFRTVAVGDVNGDGKPDVVVANFGGSTVGVLLGNGDGTFQPVMTFNPGILNPTAIEIADVNGDGKPDLVVGIWSGGVGVLLGNGDGTFQPTVAYASGGVQVSDVAVADVNHDGKPDLIVVNYGSLQGLGVLLGNGDGTFQPAASYGSGVYAWSVAVADVNGDGNSDLLVAGGLFGGAAVALGNGDGTFKPAVSYSWSGEWAQSIAVADVNGDHKPDLLVAVCETSGCEHGAAAVLLGNGDGTFQAAVDYDSGGAGANGIAVADVDGDGKPDLLVANWVTSSVGVLLGNGDGTFQPAVTYSSGGLSPMAIVAADVNGDGKPDLVVRNECSDASCVSGSVGVLLNNTAGPLNPTTTTLTSSLNPSVYGQVVTFTAHVTANSGTPTGTAVLFNGSTAVGSGTLTNGSASIIVSSLPTGADSITAKYQGGGGFSPSTSAPLTQTVKVATTTTSLTSSVNPAGANQAVTFTATVTSQFGGAATGPVVFSSGSQSLGTASLSGNIATLTTSFSTAGTYSIFAKYNGDGNNSGSTSSSLSQVIKAATVTTLVSSLNPSFVGQAVTFTATVSSSSGAPPNGETITFNNGSAVLGTAPLSGGMASLTTSSLPAGIFTVTANYAGDANFAASTSPGLRQVVNSTTKSATATTLVSNLNPSIYGQSVTWTATVTTSGSVPPTGTVNFTWGRSIGTATLNSSGVATLTKSKLNADAYPLTAVYQGDANNLGSTSAVVNQVVTETTSSATLSSSPNPSTSGHAVTFTATITSPTVTPTGPVTFAVGKTVLGTAQLSGGKAKFTTSTLAVGSTKVTAIYYGDSNIAKSSASVTQTVH